MGLKSSSLFGKKKRKTVEYSIRTVDQNGLYNTRQTSKPIYPPLSSIPNEEPKRSIMPDGGLLYQSVHMDWGPDENKSQYENTRYESSSNFRNYHTKYNDGTFSVLSRYPMNDSNVFRV